MSKNLNWEILTKNLVIFKRWDEIKDENYNMGGFKEGDWYPNVHYVTFWAFVKECIFNTFVKLMHYVALICITKIPCSNLGK